MDAGDPPVVAVVSRFAFVRAGLAALLESDPTHPMTVSRSEPGVEVNPADVVVYDLVEMNGERASAELVVTTHGLPVVGLVRAGGGAAEELDLAATVPEDVSPAELIQVVERTARERRTNARGPSATSALTRRERRVLQLVAAGLTNDQIAADLGISLNTVKFHIRGAYRAIGARHRPDAVRWAHIHGLA